MGDLQVLLSDLSRKTSRGHKAAVLFFVLIGVALRAALLGRPIGAGEAHSYMVFATMPLSELVSAYAAQGNFVFHTLLTKLSTGIFGVGVVPLRLPNFIAGVLSLPLFYLFARSMFNRYIALTTLALVACSGPLIGMGTMAVGLGVCWFCFVASLVLGRHFIKSNDLTSALSIALLNALGLWTMPSYCYAALAVFLWLLLSLLMGYDTSLRERMLRFVFAFLVFVALALLLYIPILQAHGFDQLIDHHSRPRLDWRTFDQKHTDMAFALWTLAEDATSGIIVFFGLTGLVYAAFVSSKLRILLFSMFASGVILCMIIRRIEPVGVWGFTFYIFHLSSGMALFYLLKFLQEKAFPNWSKGGRTFVASLIAGLLLVWTGSGYWRGYTAGVPQVDGVVSFAREHLKPGDKLYAQYPWLAPIQFAMRAAGADEAVLAGEPSAGGTVYVAAGSRPEQSVQAVLRANEQDPERWPAMQMVQEWPGLKIFAPRLRTDSVGASAGDAP